MSDPLITIVDKKDEVIGSADFDETYTKGLTHRIVRVMVESSDGKKILLQKRAHGMKTYPGAWDNSAAGHVDEGESYLEAAKRELFEEIGISAPRLSEINKYYTSYDLGKDSVNRFNMVYRYTYDGTPTNLQKSEVAEVRWFAIGEAKKLADEAADKTTDGLRDVLKMHY